MTFRDELARAAATSGVSLEERLLDACAAHYELLVVWNATHNLTRVTEPAEAARKHYLDCLLPLLALKAPVSFVDVGSGAGFPGLMAALAWPAASASLVEPAAKRASFLELAAGKMRLAVEVCRETASPKPAKRAKAPLTAEVVLSRATFPAAARRVLTDYAAADAGIALWGHRDDLTTWETEVATWAGWRSTVVDYAVDGLPPRCLLWAERGVFHVEHRLSH